MASRRDVHDFERGVGGGFQIEQPAAFGNRCLDGFVVGGVAQLDLDLKARQELQEQLVRPAVSVPHRDHAVAGGEQGEQGVADGGHAAGKAGGRLRAFEQAHLLFERGDGRVGVAAIDVAGRAPQGRGLPGVHVRVAEGHAVHDRYLGGAPPGVLFFPAPYRLGACAQ